MLQIEMNTMLADRVSDPRHRVGSRPASNGWSGAPAPMRKSLIPQLEEEPLSR